MPEIKLLSPRKLSDLLDVSLYTAQRLMAEGQFPTVVIGKRAFVIEDQVLAYIAQQIEPATRPLSAKVRNRAWLAQERAPVAAACRRIGKKAKPRSVKELEPVSA